MALSKRFFNLTIKLLPKMVDRHLLWGLMLAVAVAVALNPVAVAADYPAFGTHFYMRSVSHLFLTLLVFWQ